MYNFIRNKYYFDVKISTYKQKDNKELVILLEIYLTETFARVCSDRRMLIVNAFTKIAKLGKCFLSTPCQVHTELILLAKLECWKDE